MQGGFRPNGGRPRGSLNKSTLEIKQRLAPLGPPAIARVGKLIESADDDLAFEACQLALSYLYGKPRAALDVEVEPKRQELSVEEMEQLGFSDEQLRKLAGIEDGRSY